MEPEKDDGNIEYKLRLLNKDSARIDQLATQMRYRCTEGGSECFYVIGITDQGKMIGLTDEEYDESFKTLSIAAEKNGYSICKLSEKIIEDDEDEETDEEEKDMLESIKKKKKTSERYVKGETKENTIKKVYELLVREINEDTYIDLKVVIAGAVDAGKSTLIGTLTTGKNDDGRGSARLAVFNFKHEANSGRTSSIAHHILGFDGVGNVTNYSKIGVKSWPEIVRDSAKVVSFFDLAGHKKYLKTTILGMTSSSPDICMIIVGANKGVNRMTSEHLFLCITLNIPFVFVITKIDICKDRQNVLKETVGRVNKLIKLPGIRRMPYKISSEDDVLVAAKNIHTMSVVPVFHLSSVTGVGVDYLKQFLNLVGKKNDNIERSDEIVEYHIESIFYVPGVGVVVGGQLISGKIKVGDKLLLGPNNGAYVQVHVRSIHCKRVPVQEVSYGCYVCLALKKIERKNIRRGNVIVSLDGNALSIKEFTADIKVMKAHSTTIKIGYEPVVHVANIRQSAKILKIENKVNFRKRGGKNSQSDDEILRTGDTAKVTFSFVRHPEYIKKGNRLLFCQGTTRAIGVVV